jgi:hypothetical protein
MEYAVVLAIELAFAYALDLSVACTALAALAVARTGIWIGHSFRLRLLPGLFRRPMLIGDFCRGLHRVARPVV